MVGFYLYYNIKRKVKQIFCRLPAENLLENLGNLSAEPRSGEARNKEKLSKIPVWLRVLDEIRTYFKENPDEEA